jgi:hypothetical protein
MTAGNVCPRTRRIIERNNTQANPPSHPPTHPIFSCLRSRMMALQFGDVQRPLSGWSQNTRSPRSDARRIPRSCTDDVDYTLRPKLLQVTLHSEVGRLGDRDGADWRWRPDDVRAGY